MVAVAALAPASTLLSARAALGRPTLRSHAVPALSSRARGTCMRVAAQKVGNRLWLPPPRQAARRV